MCITFLFTNPNDSSYKYKLILINNRDEYFSRKTLKASVHADEDKSYLTQIFGTDVESKVRGTWLAVSHSRRDDTIRIGNLLNVPGEIVKGRKEDLRTRGPIAIEYVQTNEDIENYNKNLCDACTSYNSFNFLSVQIKSSDIKTYFTSNSTHNYEQLATGCAGFSNSPVNAPLQKVIAGREKFYQIIKDHKEGSKESMVEALNELLKCDEKHYPDEELSRRQGHDAKDFSSIHVRINELYGTRTRTIILIDQSNNIEYIEDTMVNQDPENSIWEVTNINVTNDEICQQQ